MKELKVILSDFELKIIKRIAAGKSITEIAKELSRSEVIITICRSTLLEKMKLKNNAELTLYLINNPLVMLISPPRPSSEPEI